MLSIIVSVYNVKNYLVKCLDSINAQTLTDYEVVVVDDGSTDGSGELLDAYCRDKPKFHLYHKGNGGLMSAWKYGLERANGDYIGFVDSDDYIDATMYQKLVSAAEESSAEIVLCNHYYVDESANKKTLHRNPINPGIYTGEELNQIRGKMLPLLGRDYISPTRWSKIIHKNLLWGGGKIH